MSTEPTLSVQGIQIDVVRKDVKRLRIAVYPPSGAVRLTVPAHVSDDAARLAVVSKLPWIRRQRGRYAGQERQTRRELVSGEAQYVWGRRLRLRVVPTASLTKVIGPKGGWLELHVRLGSSAGDRARVIDRWHRRQLRERAQPLIDQWQLRTGSRLNDWRIKRMKTRWGTCVPASKRIWLNVELAKKSPRCLEFIISHELPHLQKRDHGARFQALMHEWMPDWRQRRDELNRAP